MNLSYTETDRPEFTAILHSDGIVYHQRGSYLLIDTNGSQRQLLPVNRSYRPINMPRDDNIPIDNPYIANKLIHDSVSSESDLYSYEKRVLILGKTLLFLVSDQESRVTYEYSSRYGDNTQISDAAKALLERLASNTENDGLDIKVGLHGSHQVRLNGADSDMDLVAWTPKNQRAESLEAIYNGMKMIGYQDANYTSRFGEYALRIANLTGLPSTIGEYLASQRNRWISPTGTSVSLQLVHSDYQHDIAKQIIDSDLSGEMSGQQRVDDIPIEVLEGSEPFNYPRVWKISDNSEAAQVISFNMVHQGMGTDGAAASKRGDLCLSGYKYFNQTGQPIYILRNDGDYILPSQLVA